LYDLALVEHGPLPPHERTWRHPSELGPTSADLDTGSHNHVAALAIGAVAVLAVAGLVVAMTPRASSGPIALSATTVPAPAIDAPATVRAASAVSAGVSGSRIPIGALLTSFAAFPHAITSTPQLTIDGTDVADHLPDDADVVYVHTDAVTYRLPWGQVAYLAAPNGSVVFDANGDLLAHVSEGEVVMLVGG
jgi:hypothetical protein